MALHPQATLARDQEVVIKNRGPERTLAGGVRVAPGTTVELSPLDPDASQGHTEKESEAQLAAGLKRLAAYQDRLWAEAKHAVLWVLQGIDAAGKDGTIRHVVGAFDPMGCQVTSFTVPTAIEGVVDIEPSQPSPEGLADEDNSRPALPRSCESWQAMSRAALAGRGVPRAAPCLRRRGYEARGRQ